MTAGEFAFAKPIIELLARIQAVIDIEAIDGITLEFQLKNADGSIAATPDVIIQAIGIEAYGSLANDTNSALNDQLADMLAAKEAELAAI